jgi:prepilin-type N-terminal cleavage/methylation domain-containing protein
MNMNKSSAQLVRGFSLIEIAIVLVIISVLLTIVVVPLSTQIEQRRRADTEKQLESIKEAIIGFALANNRFPCPSTDGVIYGAAASNGTESPVGGGACAVKLGYVPAVTLGIAPIDATGFAVDAWGSTKNRIIYAIADINIVAAGVCPAINHPLTTSPGGMKTATMDCLSSQKLITVCSATPVGGSPGAATGCSGVTLTSAAPFVLISLGSNAPTGAVAGSDEAHNVDGKLSANQDLYFVARTPSPIGAPGGEFDDIVVWPSLNTIFGRMVQAGKLP